MNEIKDLIFKILEESPAIAIWVLVIIYGYKIAFVGSIFALIKVSIKSICNTIESLKTKSNELELAKTQAPKQWNIEGMLIQDEKTKIELSSLLSLIREKGGGPYIHSIDIRNCKNAYRKSLKEEGKV